MVMGKIERKIVEKPWGVENWIVENEHYTAKYLYINAKEVIPMHYHEHKTETLLVLDGTGELTYGLEGKAESLDPIDLIVTSSKILPGDIITFHPKTKYKIRAITGLKILEISTNHKRDMVRLEE